MPGWPTNWKYFIPHFWAKQKLSIPNPFYFCEAFSQNKVENLLKASSKLHHDKKMPSLIYSKKKQNKKKTKNNTLPRSPQKN